MSVSGFTANVGSLQLTRGTFPVRPAYSLNSIMPNHTDALPEDFDVILLGTGNSNHFAVICFAAVAQIIFFFVYHLSVKLFPNTI